MVVCIYFVHLYFAFVFSSRKHRENVFIWCIYLTRLVLALMHHHGPLHSVIPRGIFLRGMRPTLRCLAARGIEAKATEPIATRRPSETLISQASVASSCRSPLTQNESSHAYEIMVSRLPAPFSSARPLARRCEQDGSAKDRSIALHNAQAYSSECRERCARAISDLHDRETLVIISARCIPTVLVSGRKDQSPESQCRVGRLRTFCWHTSAYSEDGREYRWTGAT